jgi:hypothetical protein
MVRLKAKIVGANRKSMMILAVSVMINGNIVDKVCDNSSFIPNFVRD